MFRIYFSLPPETRTTINDGPHVRFPNEHQEVKIER